MKITHFIKVCFITLIVLLNSATISAFEALNPNKPPATSPAVNKCYEGLSKAYISLSAQMMVDTYATDGQYISGGKDTSIMQGHSELISLYQKYFARLKKHNYELDLQFRVSNRLVDTMTINDVGYYIVTIIPPKESKKPASQHAGKFMITFKKQSDDSWLIWSEANSKVSVANYISAKRQGNLLFDPYYPVEKYQHD